MKACSTLLYTSVLAVYHFIFRPFIVTSIEQVKHDITTLPDEQSTSLQHKEVISFLKTATLFTCDVTTELAFPLLDFYTLKFVVIDKIPLLLNAHKVNAFLQRPAVIFSTPFLLRGTHVLLKLNDNCTSPNVVTITETSIRASEFTAWYYFFNSGLIHLIPAKTPLGLTTKLVSIYTIRFLDRVESRFLEQKDEPFDTRFFLLPLTKSPITTICKLSIEMYLPQSRANFALEVVCNFAGELSYVQAEYYMNSTDTIPTLNVTTNYQQNLYLISKSIWKTTHQNFEKGLTGPELLGKPLGHRVVALLAPRNYMTEQLKRFFQTQDSSEYLDPDLVELCSLMGISNPTSIKTTNSLLFTDLTDGKCLSSSDLAEKILNITDNFWGEKVDIEKLIPCTTARFYSSQMHIHGMHYYITKKDTIELNSYPLHLMDFASLNSMTKHILNNSASECFEEHMVKDLPGIFDSLFNSIYSGLSFLFSQENA